MSKTPEDIPTSRTDNHPHDPRPSDSRSSKRGPKTRRRWIAPPVLALGAAALVAGCGGSSSNSATPSTGSGARAPKVAVTSFNNGFSTMRSLKPLVAKGKGKVAAILPDTVSSTRYVEFDQPDLKKALAAAGLPNSDIIVQNARGSDATQLSDAQSDISSGASVLIVDPLDSGVGASIEKYAAAHGVAAIDYDRLTLGGDRKYYVSFNNVQVGKTIGEGMAKCVANWHVTNPRMVVMHGAVTDNNATLFYQGYYDSVLKPLFGSGKYTDVANTAGTWDPPTALSEFQAAYTAHPNVNSALIANDETAAPIITYLKTHGVKPRTFPTTGQDATLTGLQNVLTGYQCGTVYKPIDLEAQAADALALYIRAGETPPASLVNGTTTDTKSHGAVQSVLLRPEWVTPSNMNATVVKDKFVPASELCSGSAASACTTAGIKK
jgi:D-xylose transport system substrate-binding protein